MKTFNKVFQNILVGTMEQSRLNGWAGKFIKSQTTSPKVVD